MSESSSNHTLSQLMANINNDKDRLFLVSILLSQMEEPFDPLKIASDYSQEYRNTIQWCFYRQDLECFTLFIDTLKNQQSDINIANNLISMLFESLPLFDYCNTFNDYLSIICNTFKDSIAFKDEFKEQRLKILNKCFSEHMFDSIDILISSTFIDSNLLFTHSNKFIQELFEKDVPVSDYLIQKIVNLINQGISPIAHNTYDNKTLLYSLYSSNQNSFDKYFSNMNITLKKIRTGFFADTVSHCCLEPNEKFDRKMETLILFYKKIGLPEEDINDVLKNVLSDITISAYSPFTQNLQQIQIELEKKLLSAEMKIEHNLPLKRL